MIDGLDLDERIILKRNLQVCTVSVHAEWNGLTWNRVQCKVFVHLRGSH
jgi:hypothetical protein